VSSVSMCPMHTDTTQSPMEAEDPAPSVFRGASAEQALEEARRDGASLPLLAEEAASLHSFIHPHNEHAGNCSYCYSSPTGRIS
jgi:hypothetical protein